MILRDYQLDALEALRGEMRQGHRHIILQALTGLGKCLGAGTPVLMYDGTIRPVEQVKPGDLLMGDDSTPRRVLSTTDGVGPMYRITPVKGDPWTCNDAHILSLISSATAMGYVKGEVYDIPLQEYLKLPAGHRHILKQFSVGVDYPERPLPLPPYWLGLWLGDGNSRSQRIHKPDEEVAEANRALAAELGGRCSELNPAGKCPSYSVVGADVLPQLRALNLLQNKHIPQVYLTNSRQNRLQLLAGLLDTDGYIAGGCFEIVQRSKALADGITQLAQSLGFKVTTRPKVVGGTAYHRLFICGDISLIPTRIPRRQAAPRRQIKDARRTGFKVEPIGEDRYFGFTLDGNRRFLLGDHTVTHNTVIASAMIHGAQAQKKVSLFVAHRIELIQQTSDKLSRFGVGHSLILPGEKPGNDELVYVGTVQSFTARIRRGTFDPARVDLIIFDECHRSSAASYQAMVEAFPKARVIGLTATPTRGDEKGLGDTYTSLVQTMTYEEAFERGYLVRPKYYAPFTPDLTRVHTRMGDFVEDELEEAMNKPKLTGDIVSHYARYARLPDGRLRLGIVFAVNVRHSIALAAAFNAAGIPAAHVDGTTPAAERREIMQDFRSGNVTVLCNVAIGTEGLDVPECSAVVLACPTKSVIKHLQTAGRALRPHPESGKTDAIILDHAGNILRLGAVEEYTSWTLETGAQRSEKARKKKERELKEITCDACGHLFYSAKVCPSCGHVHEYERAPKDIEVADGDLVELGGGERRYSQEEKQRWWGMMLGECALRGAKPGEAYYAYKKKFGVGPGGWQKKVQPISPDAEVSGWMRHYRIWRRKAWEKDRNRQPERWRVVPNRTQPGHAAD